jgi:hypothetical protein
MVDARAVNKHLAERFHGSRQRFKLWDHLGSRRHVAAAVWSSRAPVCRGDRLRRGEITCSHRPQKAPLPSPECPCPRITTSTSGSRSPSSLFPRGLPLSGSERDGYPDPEPSRSADVCFAQRPWQIRDQLPAISTVALQFAAHRRRWAQPMMNGGENGTSASFH